MEETCLIIPQNSIIIISILLSGKSYNIINVKSVQRRVKKPQQLIIMEAQRDCPDVRGKAKVVR